MIGDLKPYTAYKDSGQDWLGAVPPHWTLLRAKRLFREVDERSKTGKEELLSVSHLTGVTPRRLKTVTMFMAESNVGHKVCRPGDLVINTLWAWMAALGVTRHTGLVSPAYGVYRPIAGGGILPAYADHLLRTPMYAAEYQRRSTGVNSSRLRLYPEQFLQVAVLLPPLDEQALIVRFLDWANGRADRAIRAKRKVIALLTEQKQAIIQRAVMSGTDPSVDCKATGIAHLGDAPRTWEIRRLKSFVTNVNDQTATKTVDEIYIALEHVQSWTGRLNLPTDQSDNLFSGTVKRFQQGDVLFGKLRPYLAKVITAPSLGVCVGEFFVLRPNHHLITSLFLEQLLRTVAVIRVIDSSTFGAKMPRADWQFLGNLRVALPAVHEQMTIVESLQRETAPLAKAIARGEHEISLLHEYRARLVADVVTGRFDVREAAVRLPDESTLEIADEPTDDADDIELANEETAV